MSISTEQGFGYWPPLGTILHGWVVSEGSDAAEGIIQMRQGLMALQAAGTEIPRAYALGLLAAAYRQTGQVREGIEVLDEAFAAVNKTGGRWAEAELHLLNGELLLEQAAANLAQAEMCFEQALAVARRQQAKSLELRAVMSLSRLHQGQGKNAEAKQLLADIYGWFTEGLDTPDLRAAKALLEELA